MRAGTDGPTRIIGGRARWPVRIMLGLVVAALSVVGLALPGAADPTSTSTTPPTTPVAPPVQSVGDQQCAPPATTVVHDIPWAQQRMNPSAAWSLTTGQGITVAVIDTGVDASVPQLAGHVLAGVDVTGSGTAANTDCNGHGTFVAGIVAAQPTSGIGFAGVAPGVQILPIRQSNDSGAGSASGIATAIKTATDMGAHVINISEAATAPSDDLQAAVNYAEQNNVVIVAAAANQAKQGDPRSYPASYPGVIAVGAVGQNDQRSDFSETGDFIDLVAPGDNVLSLGTGGPGHLIGQGTSYAAPFVAGVAALVRAYRPNLTAAQVKRRLELTADHPGTALPDPQLGWGEVNPMAAVTEALPEETGQAAVTAPRQQRVTVPPTPQPPDSRPRDVGLMVTFGAFALAIFVGLAAVIIPRGRRRGWRSSRAA